MIVRLVPVLLGLVLTSGAFSAPEADVPGGLDAGLDAAPGASLSWPAAQEQADPFEGVKDLKGPRRVNSWDSYHLVVAAPGS